MKKNFSKTILVLIFTICFIYNVLGQFSKTKESIYSGIYTFITNTTWERESSLTCFSIGILDSDTVFYNMLYKKFKGIKLKRKTPVILRFSKIEEIKPTQVLYVEKNFNKNIDRIVNATEGKNTLLVTNTCGNGKLLMINFTGVLKKKLFEVNLENIDKAGLKLSQHFIDFANGKIGWEELYLHSETLLENERDIVNNQLKTIKKGQNIINSQLNAIEKGQNTIKNQLDTIKTVQNTVIDQSQKISSQQLELYRKNQVVEMQRYILVLLGLILILVLGMLYVIFRNYKQKKEANKTITAKNAEIEQAYEEILAQRDEIESQRDMVIEQKKKTEHFYNGLMDSIRYASLIQTAVLPNDHKIRETINNDYFVLYNPRNIVSGDFFFVEKYENRSFIAVGDCTGHGVPGAFMSMLSMGLLKEIVYNQPNIQANQVLVHLRLKIINALQQKGLQDELKDGMDISLLIIDNDTLEYQWAGAFIPLYIYMPQTNELMEISPDKQPIGIHPEMRDFTTHRISPQPGSILYLFTDGIVDQFGGPYGKKLKYRQFREMLLENSTKPMREQYINIKGTVEKWRSSFGEKFEQTDDITVLGLKI